MKLVKDMLRIKIGDLDSNPKLLAALNGVINLEDGTLRPGRPQDYITRHCGCEYRGLDEPAPVFESFIAEILMNDAETIEFFQRFLGYAITGETKEDKMLFLIGKGGNGKTILLNILEAVLGDMFWAADSELLLLQQYAKPAGQPTPELASLRGRRMIVTEEFPEGRKIDEARFKRLTGSSIITCRSPHARDEVNFRSTGKIIVATNHRPEGLATDDAMRRRLLYLELPLLYKEDPDYEASRFPAQAHLFRKRDPDLKDKLMKELPGILAWLVRGSMKYYKQGLNPPKKMLEAVETIRREEDVVGRFIEDCCIVDPASHVLYKDAYERFGKWYEDETGAQNCMSKPKWSKELNARGYTVKGKSGNNRHIHGLKLRNAESGGDGMLFQQ